MNFLTKIDQSNKTGAQGGPESKLDDTDKLVIEIIGKESPVVQGIDVPDSMETISEVKDITEDFSYSMPNENDDNGTTKSKCSLQQSSCRAPLIKGDKYIIQKYVLPKASLNGILSCSSTYTEVYRHFQYFKNPTRVVPCPLTLQRVKACGINAMKKKDVSGLFCFLDEASIQWIQQEVFDITEKANDDIQQGLDEEDEWFSEDDMLDSDAVSE
ncbi:unnamed protein product [Psylliodes chrysocephalus]|uniref:Uncharacterized protein n=1 Tax=Psylliodes chrysocephalus TaxID=3402493 RepID=A0A9P0D3Q7_9CUCU|nr:unnamed protein product [Psylliodes chrysocephala]